MKRVKVYIASPYSNGNKEELVRLHMDAAYHLLKMGFNPYAPLYNHYIQVAHDDIDTNFNWLELDEEWLAMCDIMIRLHVTDEHGEEISSPGADYEERYAKELGIPIFHFDSLSEMVRNVASFKPTL